MKHILATITGMNFWMCMFYSQGLNILQKGDWWAKGRVSAFSAH
jgi:hypothetical protein